MNLWAETIFITTHSSCGIQGSEMHVVRILKNAQKRLKR